MAKCQQGNLREIQQENLKLLNCERQKMQKLLDLLLPQKERPAKPGAQVESSGLSKGVVLHSKVVTKPVVLTTQPVALKNLSISQDRANEVDPQSNTKKPFPFLKKGVGLSKYKRLSRSGVLREDQPAQKPLSTVPTVKTKKPQQLPKELKFKRVTFQESNHTKTEPVSLKSELGSSQTKTDALVSINTTELKEPFQAKVPVVNQEVDTEELAEFEILEKVTHNCSLDSDSSFVNCLLNVRSKSCMKEQEFGGHELDIPETELTECQFVLESSPAISSPNFNAALSSAFKNSEIRHFPQTKTFDKVMFEDEHSWADTNVQDFTDDSSVDERLDKGSPEVLSNAFEEARTELLRVPEQVPTKERLLLQDRLNELETEIKNFRKENAFLAKLKDEHEQAKKELEKEKKLVKKLQDDERETNNLLKEERKKLKKQQQLLEMHWKAKQENPDKKEREEIAALKSEVKKLQEEVKKQRVQWLAECGRLRTQLASVECEKERLQCQIKKLEEENVRLAQINSTSIKSTSECNGKANKCATKPVKSLVKKSYVRKPVNPKVVPKRDDRTTKGILKKPEVEKSKENIFTVDLSPVHLETKTTESSESKMEKTDANNPDEVVEIIEHADKTEKILRSGEHEYLYSSGTRKITSSDASSSQVFFYNGDVMMTLPDKTEIYYFLATGTKQTRYPDETVLLEYADGREEKNDKNGLRQLKYQDGTMHFTFPDGTQEIRSPEGTILKIQSNGEELVEFPNGERELRTKEFKRREYLNGSSKTIYNDGRQETQYADGRVRLKDKDGNILSETKCFA